MVTLRTIALLMIAGSIANSARAQEHFGRDLYLERCADCHGAELQGQPDWMRRLPSGRLPAPPHDATGHTWHHSDKQLLGIIRDGLSVIAPGYETDMPSFRDNMTDAEIEAVLEYIKSTWPERERDIQSRRSAADSD